MSTVSQFSQQQTRQQLDELDALLQRMLSVPVGGESTSASEPSLSEAMKSDDFAPFPPALPGAQVFPQPVAPTSPTAPVIQAWRVEVPIAPNAAGYPASPPLALLV